MADALLEPIRDFVDGGAIDFEGQRLVEQMSTNILAVVGLISFTIGWFMQNMSYTLWSGLGGTALIFLAVIPPWPFFNQNNVRWLAPRSQVGAINISLEDKAR